MRWTLAIASSIALAAPALAETLVVPGTGRPVVVIVRKDSDPPADVFIPAGTDWVLVNRLDDTPVTVGIFEQGKSARDRYPSHQRLPPLDR